MPQTFSRSEMCSWVSRRTTRHSILTVVAPSMPRISYSFGIGICWEVS